MDFEISGDSEGVRGIRLDDGVRNVFTLAAATALDAHLRAAEEDPAVNTVILSGRPEALSVGLDTQVAVGGGDDAERLFAAIGRVLSRLYLGPLRSVVVAEGHATAAGAMLLLVADHRIGIAAPGKIGLSEVRYGLDVPVPTQQLVRDRIGPQFQYAATAGAVLFDATGARQAGFLDELAPDRDTATQLARAAATRLSALPDAGYIATKRGMRRDFARLYAG